jgi:hypothetical protein
LALGAWTGVRIRKLNAVACSSRVATKLRPAGQPTAQSGERSRRPSAPAGCRVR